MSHVDVRYSKISKSKRKKLVNRSKSFAPSGLAVHPLNEDLYILSAKGSLLVIFDKTKFLKRVIFLNSKTIPQPEGIAFDQLNHLYIATEGQGFSGKIFKFNYL